MRVARDWFTRDFHPQRLEDVFATMAGEHNPHFRMVAGYWDMAASFVTHGAIDPAMFRDASSEGLTTLAKIHPFLDVLRAAAGIPEFLGHLERVVLSWPGAEQRMAMLREQLRAASAAAR